MRSAGMRPPRPPLPRLVVVALAACTLLAVGHALPQGTSEDVTRTLGAACSSADDCTSITQAECRNSTCRCLSSHPVANGDECLAESWLKGTCKVSAQCQRQPKATCLGNKCVCIDKHRMHTFEDGTTTCIPTQQHLDDAKKDPVDPVMIGILVSLVLMFLIICIVLQLFSKARFRQNRTILNSANPRLMNTSFLKSTKLGSAGARGRRGSRGSITGGQEQTLERTNGAGLTTEAPASTGSDPTADKAA